MLMVEFMSSPIEELAEIEPLPDNVISAKETVSQFENNVIPDEFPVRGCDPESSKFKAFWMPDQVRRDDFGF
jgi:hypothetical protein